MGIYGGIWSVQINLRNAFGLDVLHFLLSVSCLGLGLDLVSIPQIHDLVSVSIHSGLCH